MSATFYPLNASCGSHTIVLAALLLFGLPGVQAQSIDEAMVAYRNGNHQDAAEQLRSLAHRGDIHAQGMLGSLHQYGQGVDKDEGMAYFWWLVANKHGHFDAPSHLAELEKQLTPQQRTAIKIKAQAWRPATR